MQEPWHCTVIGRRVALAVAACSAAAFLGTCAIPSYPDLPDVDFFRRSPETEPVITSGEAGMPIYVMDPGVYADEEGLHLFFTTPFCRQGDRWYYSLDPARPQDCDPTNPLTSIGYAFSSDGGLTWTFRETPVIMPGPEEWQQGMETAFPVRIGGKLYVFYSALGDLEGAPFTGRYQIGAAVLEQEGPSLRDTLMDPSMVLVQVIEPVVARSLERTDRLNNAQEPSVVVRGARVEVYFTGLGLRKPGEPLTADGQGIASIDFMRQVFDTELRPVGEPERMDIDPEINIQEVHWQDGRYHVFFTTLAGGEFHKGERLGYATSADGVHWKNLSEILAPGTPGSFDDWGTMAPTVAFREGVVLLFYTGFQEAALGGRLGHPVGQERVILANVGRAVAETLEAP
jgi:hypothetical protein